jgi:hypothetical protein
MPDTPPRRCAGATVGAAPAEGASLTAELQAALLASAPAPDASSPLPHGRTPPLLTGGANKRRGPRSATSKFRGVSCYKRYVTRVAAHRAAFESRLAALTAAHLAARARSTGRWESHIWSNGKQVHLGSFRSPEEAARCVTCAISARLRGAMPPLRCHASVAHSWRAWCRLVALQILEIQTEYPARKALLTMRICCATALTTWPPSCSEAGTLRRTTRRRCALSAQHGVRAMEQH